MDTKTKIEPEEEGDSSQPVLVLTPDYYPDNEALIDVKVKLECPEISQIETKPDPSSNLITCNLRSLKNETSLVITNVYSIHGGSGFDENNDHSNSLKPQEQEQPSVHHEYQEQEVIIASQNPKLNLSLHSPKILETDNPIKNSTSRTKIKNQCSYCFDAFPSSTELENHIQNNHEQTEGLLNQHIKAVHNINSTIANQSHEKKRKLSLELETKSTYPTPTHTDYMCEDCYKIYSRKQLLILHTSKYHDKQFYCDFCCKSFTNERELLEHFGTLSLFNFLGKTKLDCKICFEPIKSKCEVYIHINCHLKSSQEPVGPKVHKRKNFECDVCLRTFESELYFVNHKRLAHPNSKWKCSRCLHYFTTYFECRAHQCSSLLLYKNIPKIYRPIRNLADAVLDDVDDEDEDHISNCSSENSHDNDDAHLSHEEQEVIKIPALALKQTVTCDICLVTFLTHAGLLCHNRKHHRI